MRSTCWIVAGLLLALAGCSSNRGKLVGKWEATSEKNKTELREGLTFVMEFRDDGTFTFTFTDDKETMTVTGEYSLGMGYVVFLKNVTPAIEGSDHSTEMIYINDDKLTLRSTYRDNPTTLTFRRVS